MTDLALATGAGCRTVSSRAALGAEELCRTYAERAFRFAAMIARGNPEAEDIAQEALLKAIRRLDAYDRRRGSVETWLWSIVVSAARDAGRQAGRRLALWERLTRLPEESISVESIVLDRLSDAHLLNAVRHLPAPGSHPGRPALRGRPRSRGDRSGRWHQRCRRHHGAPPRAPQLT